MRSLVGLLMVAALAGVANGDGDPPPAAAASPAPPPVVTTSAPRQTGSSRDPGEVEGGEPADPIARAASRFRGSVLLFDQSITPETMSRGAQLSQVPSYQWWFSLRPRFYLKKYLSIRARLDLTVEWTNSGSETTLVRQPLIGDLWTDLAYGPPKLWGIQSVVSLRAIWGTSLDSRGDTSIARIGPAISLTRPFRTRIGEIEPTFGIYALYNFVKNRSSILQHEYSCTSTEFMPTFCGQNGGQMNAQASLVALFGFRYSPHEQWGLNLSYLVFDSWAYRVPTATITDATGGTTTVGLDHDQRFRQSSYFLASVDYDPTAWLGLSIGYYVFRSVRDPDGGIGNPLYAPGGRTRVFFTTSFNLDKIYESAHRRIKRGSARPVAWLH